MADNKIDTYIELDNMDAWDVTVNLYRDGEIVSSTSGIAGGASSELGTGMLGYMQLGGK